MKYISATEEVAPPHNYKPIGHPNILTEPHPKENPIYWVGRMHPVSIA